MSRSHTNICCHGVDCAVYIDVMGKHDKSFKQGGARKSLGLVKGSVEYKAHAARVQKEYHQRLDAENDGYLAIIANPDSTQAAKQEVTEAQARMKTSPKMQTARAKQNKSLGYEVLRGIRKLKKGLGSGTVGTKPAEQ